MGQALVIDVRENKAIVEGQPVCSSQQALDEIQSRIILVG